MCVIPVFCPLQTCLRPFFWWWDIQGNMRSPGPSGRTGQKQTKCISLIGAGIIAHIIRLVIEGVDHSSRMRRSTALITRNAAVLKIHEPILGVHSDPKQIFLAEVVPQYWLLDRPKGSYGLCALPRHWIPLPYCFATYMEYQSMRCTSQC